MSEFSPLRDPVFVLSWQVHLAVVSLFALLGVWAGMTRRAWYIAPTLFCGLLWLFIPLEAPEPALVLLLAVPCLAVACRLVRPWIDPPPVTSRHALASGVIRRGWNFRLADLLWLTLIVGMVTSLVIQLWRLDWAEYEGREHGLVLKWSDLALGAACFDSIAFSVLVTSRQSTWKHQALAGVIALVFGFTAISIHFVVVNSDFLLIYGWASLIPDATDTWLTLLLIKRATTGHSFLLYLLSFAEYFCIVGLGLGLLLPRTIKVPRWLSIASKSVAMASFLALATGLAVVYVEILNRPTWPDEHWPEINEREGLLAVLKRCQELNPDRKSLDELQMSGQRDAAYELAEQFKNLDKLLQRDSVSVFDSRYDRVEDGSRFDSLTNVRHAGLMLSVQAKSDWKLGRREEAINHDLVCLQLAKVYQRQCTANDALVGNAMEGVALQHLGRIRKELLTSERQSVIWRLERLAAAHESLPLLLARSEVFNEEDGGWPFRLRGAIHRLRGVAKPETQAIEQALKVRDAMLSLLITDLAIRCYHETNGHWPADLQALAPEQLATLPLDPFSEQPLVYRVVDDGFMLYSVGRDGVDSGGKFGKAWQSDTPDLDLDAWEYEED